MSFVSNLINNVANKFKSKYGTEESVNRTTKAVTSSLKDIALDAVSKSNTDNLASQSSGVICEYPDCGVRLRKKNYFNENVYCNKHFKSVKNNFVKETKIQCIHIFGQGSQTPGERCKAGATDGKYCNRHKPKRNDKKTSVNTEKKEKPRVQEPQCEDFDFSSEPIDITKRDNSRFWRMNLVDLKINGTIETVGYHKITGLFIEEVHDNGYYYVLRAKKDGNIVIPIYDISSQVKSWCKASKIRI